MSATAVVEVFRHIGVVGGLKKLVIKGNGSTNTGHTVDLGTDSTDAKGVVISEVTDAYHVGATGTRVDASWVASTGIVTLATVASGPATVYIHIEGY